MQPDRAAASANARRQRGSIGAPVTEGLQEKARRQAPPSSSARRPAGRGAPKITGSATYDAAQQQYTLSAGGVNMWAQKDEFHFVWKRMTGDFILQARVELLGQGVNPHRKVGLQWCSRMRMRTHPTSMAWSTAMV